MSSTQLRTIASVAVFAALIIASGMVSIPSPVAGVPIVLQNAFCVLAGLVLGPKRGTLAVAVFLLLGVIGLPVLPGGRTVLAAMAGPTAGYLVGYLFSAPIAGWISQGSLKRPTGAMTVSFAAAAVVALLSQYVFGVPGLMIRSGLDLQAAVSAQVAFLPGLVIKAIAITVISVAVVRALPDVR